MAVTEDVEISLASKFQALFPHLDERQQRLAAGAEARSLGHGGIRVVARAAGMREGTVSDGVAELESGADPLGRVRRVGGGRKRLADLDPGLVPALLALVEPEERGDPISPLRWTTKSLRTLARELTAAGHVVGRDTVAGLLREQGFSLQGNAKMIEGRQSPDRDAQFRYIYRRVGDHLASGDPVVSVDTKKKELVGDFHHAGLAWRPAGDPVLVNDHDFPDAGVGKAVPYGIYDLAANTGWVNVGVDHDTAEFAVESIRRWWNGIGKDTYPEARRLLITADAGGSNAYRTRAWKAHLAAFAVETGLDVGVCHFPPGTSKWNKIEHRLFSAITVNWRGRPLTSFEVVVQSIAATTTRTGLRVVAELDTNDYAKGVRVPDAQMDVLPLTRHEWHGDWNYTLHPSVFDHIDTSPDPFDQMSPDLAWLCHPALTGMPPAAWHALVHRLLALHEDQREASLDKRRGHRPRLVAPGTGRRPVLTLADRLMAVVLHQRHRLPQVAVAALFSVRPETVNKRIRNLRELLETAGHTIEPAGHRITNLDDLHDYAAANGVTTVMETKPAR
jgi:hypothetical protein